MRKIIAIILSLAFLVYGLIRMGVSSLLLTQLAGLIDIEAFYEPLAEIPAFMAKHEDKQIVPFTTGSYLSYIFVMGVCLTTGAAGSLFRRNWGHILIGIYLLMHAALFLNFQTINPKVIHLSVTVLIFIVLLWANRRPVHHPTTH